MRCNLANRCLLKNRFFRGLPATIVLLSIVASQESAAAPTAEQALALVPVQKGVVYERPTGDAVKQCTIEPEKNPSGTAWVVRDGNGQILRRFADTNADNVVDSWSYFLEGVEVYRDLDSNFDNRADQYRWFQSAGARWGIDENQDGKIESWRVISPHEVAELVVRSIAGKDEATFRSLLMTGKELKQLGAGATLRAQIARSTSDAPSKFRRLISQQQAISPSGVFADFGAARPSMLPADADGSTKDIIVHRNVSALVREGGKTEQVQIGLLVKVGEAWRLVEAPTIGDETVGLTVATSLTASTQADAGPTEEMQVLMAKLENLDQLQPATTPEGRAVTLKRRAKLLSELVVATPVGGIRDQWFDQLADMYSAAVISGDFDEGSTMLEQLDARCREAGASVDAQAHVRFQRLYTDWVVRSQDPKVDYTALQDEWRKTLQGFTKVFPASPDTAEALLQLGMVDDLAGRDEDAEKWYERLAKDFDDTPRGAKAAGALTRLRSPGKTVSLRGGSLRGQPLSLADYRGKQVVVQYWATWCEPCKEDMAILKDLVAKFGGKGFAVLGVNLDNEIDPAQQFAQSERLPWRSLHEPGGLEGRLANEMGVINLPLMLLIDNEGKVISRNIRADEVETQLLRLIK